MKQTLLRNQKKFPAFILLILVVGLSFLAIQQISVVADGEYPDTSIVDAEPIAAAPALVGHWKMNGNGNNEVPGMPAMTLLGSASFQTANGLEGSYLNVPSGGNHAYIAWNSAYDIPNNFTLQFWFRQYSNQGAAQELLVKGTNGNYNWYVFRQLWNQYNYGPVICGYNDAGSGSWQQTSNPNEPPHGIWHHVAYVKDTAGHRYYIDGKMINDNNYEFGPARVVGNYNILIGSTAINTDFDDLKIYNYSRSMNEIRSEYAQYFPVASFNIPESEPYYVNQMLNFQGSAYGGSGTYTYAWDFGDGSTGVNLMATYTYTTSGNFIVKFNVTDIVTGRWNTAIRYVYINSIPPVEVDFTWEQIGDYDVSFTEKVWSQFPITRFEYIWGDGLNSLYGNKVNTTHNYLSFGQYFVELKVKQSGDGNEYSVGKWITVSWIENNPNDGKTNETKDEQSVDNPFGQIDGFPFEVVGFMALSAIAVLVKIVKKRR
jgi:hypothetical protein